MNSATTTGFVPSRRMGICEPIHQMEMWANEFIDTSSSPILLEFNAAKVDNQSSDTSHATAGPYQESSKPNDKVLRRLAQNREAARRSRLRKKAYVQQLENSRLRLIQLEQQLDRVRQQHSVCAGAGLEDTSLLGSSGTLNPGVATFEVEYGQWVEINERKITELRDALTRTDVIGDGELRAMVQNAMKHYLELFAMKAKAAKSDVFYIISGMWRTPAERFFLWIGGFRPSETLKVLLPHMDTLSEKQCLDVCNLTQSCQQAEDALSQGLDKLHYVLAEAIAEGAQLGEGNYLPQLSSTVEKFEALVRFVAQADHLRRVTLEQISRILTTRQTARALLALGEYTKRLRALSSYWPNHITPERSSW